MILDANFVGVCGSSFVTQQFRNIISEKCRKTIIGGFLEIPWISTASKSDAAWMNYTYIHMCKSVHANFYFRQGWFHFLFVISRTCFPEKYPCICLSINWSYKLYDFIWKSCRLIDDSSVCISLYNSFESWNEKFDESFSPTFLVM